MKNGTKQWVPASIVKKVTGLSNNEMRQLRRYDLIEYRTTQAKTIRYNLNSIPPSITAKN